ncbi:MAG: hypothetical protein JSW34_04300 [Candidatus Zixiibacteriota bacterium]|nr:MAG: hypothetical protein JSW34_04300 [candidate division Zixibacteria bacterium]
MKNLTIAAMALTLLALAVAGCDKVTDPLTDNSAPAASDDAQLSSLVAASWSRDANLPPSPLVTAEFGSSSLEFWPYSGGDFTGAPHDPINVIFIGNADPRDIRAALLSLDGDRSPYLPDQPPFNCTWDDAIGTVQTGYGSGEEWVGGVIQLECCNFGPLRYHLRLFRLGQWTIGSAHFELQIPGTTEHQVLSWQCAEQLVMIDFMRSGLLDENVPMVPTAQINETTFRTIPAMIYNDLPVELRGYIEGPLGDVTDDVPIKNGDGAALIFNVAGSVPRVAETRIQDFVVSFDQVIPKPFCWEDPFDYVYVKGPVHLYQVAELTAEGDYTFSFRADGDLEVTPIDPLTGDFVGEPLTAQAREHHAGSLTDQSFLATSWLYQKILPSSDPESGKLFIRLRVSSDGVNSYEADEKCPEQTDWFAYER